MIQGSEEWKAARCGKVTASRVADVVARTKTGWGASRANYMAELVAERLTGIPAESYVNAAMQWGTDHEAEARDAYAFHVGQEVEQVALVAHPTIPDSAASPDGLVGTDGLVEFKCPNTATHIETLLGQSIPAKYITQMQWQMACTKRQWCDFVSYDPWMPGALQLFVKRLARDDKQIDALEADVSAFLQEVADKLAALESQTHPAREAA